MSIRKPLGWTLLVITVLIFTSTAAGTFRDDRLTLTHRFGAGQPLPATPGVHVTFADATLRPAPAWPIRALDDVYQLPLFGPDDTTEPEAIIQVPVAWLAQWIRPPTDVDDPIRVDAHGDLLAECPEPAQRTGALACLKGTRAPTDPVVLLLGLTVLALPLVLLSLWLIRSARPRSARPGSGAHPLPRPSAGKVAKVAIVLAFVILVPLAKLADDVPIPHRLPAAVPEAIEPPPSVARAATRALPDGMEAVRIDSEHPLALELLGKARDAKDWYQRLEALDLLPDTEHVREQQALDTRIELIRRKPGLYLRVRSQALMEERVSRLGQRLASRAFFDPGPLSWDALLLRRGADDTVGYMAHVAALDAFGRGTLVFEQGDWAALEAGQMVRLRSEGTEPLTLVRISGDQMVVRRTASAPLRIGTER